MSGRSMKNDPIEAVHIRVVYWPCECGEPGCGDTAVVDLGDEKHKTVATIALDRTTALEIAEQLCEFAEKMSLSQKTGRLA